MPNLSPASVTANAAGIFKSTHLSITRRPSKHKSCPREVKVKTHPAHAGLLEARAQATEMSVSSAKSPKAANEHSRMDGAGADPRAEGNAVPACTGTKLVN